jgi:hypothetical protein
MLPSSSNNIIPQLIKNFIFGGLAVASTSYIATFLNPIIAGIWWSYPVSIIPVLYFMSDNKLNNKHIAKFLLGITIVSVLTILCCYLLSYFIKHSADGLIVPIIKATVIWLLGCIVFYASVVYGGYAKYFS